MTTATYCFVLRFFIARLTLLDAFFEYFRAMNVLRLHGTNPCTGRWFRFRNARLERDGIGRRLLENLARAEAIITQNKIAAQTASAD